MTQQPYDTSGDTWRDVADRLRSGLSTDLEGDVARLTAFRDECERQFQAAVADLARTEAALVEAQRERDEARADLRAVSLGGLAKRAETAESRAGTAWERVAELEADNARANQQWERWQARAEQAEQQIRAGLALADRWDGYGHGKFNTHLEEYLPCEACNLLAELRAALSGVSGPSGRTQSDDESVFIGSSALLTALHDTYVEHIGITEHEGPDGPYLWCACGWRSDDLDGHGTRSDNPELSYAVHLTNAQHAAAVKALQPIVRRVSGVSVPTTEVGE